MPFINLTDKELLAVIRTRTEALVARLAEIDSPTELRKQDADAVLDLYGAIRDATPKT